MKPVLFAVMILGLLFGKVGANPHGPDLVAYMSGPEVVPATTSRGHGGLGIVLGYGGHHWLYAYYADLDASVTGLTIHEGEKGVNGPSVCTAFAGYFSSGAECYDLGWTPDFTALDAGRLYAVIHTEAYPDGEIRGQLRRGDDTPLSPATWGKLRTIFR